MSDDPSIRAGYQRDGVERYYREHGGHYANPHGDVVHALIRRCVREWSLELSRVLDLAAGAGEATIALRAAGAGQIDAIDPYTAAAYERATGAGCEPLRFEDVAAGAIRGRRYTLVVCSFALHLVESSRLPAVVMELAAISPALLVLTPHKRPVLKDAWGYRLLAETLHQRVRARLYATT